MMIHTPEMDKVLQDMWIILPSNVINSAIQGLGQQCTALTSQVQAITEKILQHLTTTHEVSVGFAYWMQIQRGDQVLQYFVEGQHLTGCSVVVPWTGQYTTSQDLGMAILVLQAFDQFLIGLSELPRGQGGDIISSHMDHNQVKILRLNVVHAGQQISHPGSWAADKCNVVFHVSLQIT